MYNNTMTKMMRTVDIANMVWNDSQCWCNCPDRGDLECMPCKIETFHDKISEFGEVFLNSIEIKGILTPISVRDDVVMNGHHRLAYAICAMLEEVPVTFGDDNVGEDEGLPYSFS